MNIMFEESITDEVREKYTLLELDTFLLIKELFLYLLRIDY